MKQTQESLSILDDATDQWIRDSGNRLAEVTGAKLVLLFGSLAYGVADADSDADFCCVVPNGTNLRKASRDAQMAFFRRRRPMDFYLIEESDFFAGKTILAREIKRSGIPVFSEKTGR